MENEDPYVFTKVEIEVVCRHRTLDELLMSIANVYYWHCEE